MRIGKFFIVLLSLVSSITSKEELPKQISTLNTLKIKSSKVLSNFQGEEPNPTNRFNSHSYWDGFRDVYPLERSLVVKFDFIQNKQYKIRQIDENTFEVLGSPIEWPE